MKRISLILPVFLLLLSLLSASYAMPQGEGEPDVLRRNGPHVLTHADLNVYHSVVAFTLDRALSLSEKAEIKQIVIKGFDTDPQGVMAEIRSLSWAMSEIAKIQENTKAEEVRVRFRQHMIDYQAQGKENPIVSLVLARF